MALLEVRNLCTSFFTDSGEVRAVNNVSFDIKNISKSNKREPNISIKKVEIPL